jgi:hypothetical protein
VAARRLRANVSSTPRLAADNKYTGEARTGELAVVDIFYVALYSPNAINQ